MVYKNYYAVSLCVIRHWVLYIFKGNMAASMDFDFRVARSDFRVSFYVFTWICFYISSFLDIVDASRYQSICFLFSIFYFIAWFNHHNTRSFVTFYLTLANMKIKFVLTKVIKFLRRIAFKKSSSRFLFW